MHGLVDKLRLFWALAILMPAAPIEASTLLEAGKMPDAIAIGGLEDLHNSRFAAARRAFESYESEAPDDPLADLLFLKLNWWAIVEGRDEQAKLDTEFRQRFERIKNRCEKMLKHNENNVRALYTLGEAYCTFGRLEGIRGHAWSTLRKHQAGTPLLERALDLNSELVAPLASLGVFHYYASRAPGFLRFLARLFSVEADRPRGMQELWLATTRPGIQQAEAAFFLLEILTNVEDAQLEALPVALEFHTRYPHGLGFRISLTAVQVAMERPDAAVEVLEESMSHDDVHIAIASRFFLARALSMTGRAYEAIEILESFRQPDFEEVEWLRAWASYYLGSAYEQVGRWQEAKEAYERTRRVPKVADSHGFAETALDRKPGSLYVLALHTESRLSWDRDLDLGWDHGEFLQMLENDSIADRETRARARYAAAAFLIRRDRYDEAAELLKRVYRYTDSQEAWLHTRPRIRLLQSLLWAGRIDDARKYALDFSKKTTEWGSNRQLELLIESCLNLDASQTLFLHEPMPRPGDEMVTFRFKDIGFTQVRLELPGRRGPAAHAMRLEAGYWVLEIPMAPGKHRYRFAVESGLVVPDPAQRNVDVSETGLWSVRSVGPSPHS